MTSDRGGATRGPDVGVAGEIGEVDYLLAVTAGPATWADAPRKGGWLRLSLAAEIGLFAVTTAWLVVEIVRTFRPLLALVLAIAALAAAAAFVWSETLLVVGRLRRTDRHGRRACVRFVAAGALAVLWMRVIGIHTPPAAFAYVLPGGIDLACTTLLLGSQPTSSELVRRVLISPVHVGIVAVLLPAALLPAFHADRSLLLRSYVAFVFDMIGAMVAASLWMRLVSGVVERAQRSESAATREVQRQLAHWLHDDVCGQLGLLRLRAERGELAPSELLEQLDAIDDELRRQQLDQLILAESGTIAKVLQPSLRRAQHAGVTITEVPRSDVGGILLAAAEAKLLARAVSVLVTNAINAGASELAIRVRADARGERVDLEVEDDAGGFDRAHLHAGRGLTGLVEDLGEGNLTVNPTARGSIVAASVRSR